MRILWLVNIMLPVLGRQLGLPYSNKEGWLSGIYSKIAERQAAGAEGVGEQIVLGVCFPAPEGLVDKKVRCGENIFYGFREDLSRPERYDPGLEERFAVLLQEFQPDVVHIFGVEYPHALAMVRAFGCPGRTLIGIQGLCFACAEAYMADLPERVQDRYTFRDLLRGDNLRRQQEKFRVRGEREKEALRGAGHLAGRTSFDRKAAALVNPDARYHLLNETLRGCFYEGKWERDKCRTHSIFLSQGDYPLKGFHYVLEAMPEILGDYPDARVYVAGDNLIGRSLMEKLKRSSYGKYLLSLIREYGLERRVNMLGRCPAERMKEEYRSSHLFICPSSLENSPNSLGEAMLLGMPCVAARVGGIPDLLEDGSEGRLYEPGNVQELAAAVKAMWADEGRAEVMGQAARIHARETHDPDRNCERLMEIYGEIAGGEG